jgi:hypothetical protein
MSRGDPLLLLPWALEPDPLPRTAAVTVIFVRPQHDEPGDARDVVLFQLRRGGGHASAPRRVLLQDVDEQRGDVLLVLRDSYCRSRSYRVVAAPSRRRPTRTRRRPPPGQKPRTIYRGSGSGWR